MQLLGGHIRYSPSDLANFIACEHLTQLDVTIALGESTRPSFGNAYTDLIKRKGEERERNFIEVLGAAGHVVTQVGLGEHRNSGDIILISPVAAGSGFSYLDNLTIVTPSAFWSDSGAQSAIHATGFPRQYF